MGRNAGERRSVWRFHSRNAVPAIHKVVDLALCCSRHKIAVKCTKMQEFACNFEKFLGVTTPEPPQRAPPPGPTPSTAKGRTLGLRPSRTVPVAKMSYLHPCITQ
jgi:hypothetical protein